MENQYKAILDQTYASVINTKNDGKLATYIPALGRVDPTKFGACISTLDNEAVGVGDFKERFSIQSIAKVLSLTLAYNELGEDIWDKIGVEPSGTAFNSLVQLEVELGIPRNPLINAGAIVVCDLLCSHFEDPKKELLHFIARALGNETITFDFEIAESERKCGFRNYALINLMKSFGRIENDIEIVLDLYFHLSSIKMNAFELSKTFLFLANKGKRVSDGLVITTEEKSRKINGIMATCGFYDEAGGFAFSVGLPGKSGVGGGIAAVLPGVYAIVVWSPKLNPKGNSHRGLKFLQEFIKQTKESIF